MSVAAVLCIGSNSQCGHHCGVPLAAAVIHNITCLLGYAVLARRHDKWSRQGAVAALGNTVEKECTLLLQSVKNFCGMCLMLIACHITAGMFLL
jgi:hypothetical protein